MKVQKIAVVNGFSKFSIRNIIWSILASPATTPSFRQTLEKFLEILKNTENAVDTRSEGAKTFASNMIELLMEELKARSPKHYYEIVKEFYGKLQRSLDEIEELDRDIMRDILKFYSAWLKMYRMPKAQQKPGKLLRHQSSTITR